MNRTGGVPHTGVPFQLLGAQRVTLPAPFSFEERTKQMLMKKDEKIRKFLETERKVLTKILLKVFLTDQLIDRFYCVDWLILIWFCLLHD